MYYDENLQSTTTVLIYFLLHHEFFKLQFVFKHATLNQVRN